MTGATACLLVAAAATLSPAVETVKGDARALLPGRAQLTRRTAVALLGLAAVLAADRPLSRSIADGAPGELHRLEPLGRVAAGNAAAAGLLGVGLLAGDCEVRVAGLTALEANVVTGWLVTLGQRLAGRQRPGRPHQGQWREGGSSFPSSHAAHAFAWAGVLYEAFPAWRGRWLLPALAGAVALSRVADRQHFLGDAAAGAALGWWIGSRLERVHRSSGRVEVAVVGMPGRGLGLDVRLP